MNAVYEYAVNNQASMKSFARKISPKLSPEFIEDVVQDCLLRLYYNKAQVNCKPETYVFSTVKHAIYNFLRGSNHRRLSSAVDISFVDIEHNDNPEKLLMNAQTISLVRPAINTLKGKQKDAVLSWMDGDATLAVLADEAGIHRDTYKANFRWGVLKLKENLDPLIDSSTAVVCDEQV